MPLGSQSYPQTGGKINPCLASPLRHTFPNRYSFAPLSIVAEGRLYASMDFPSLKRKREAQVVEELSAFPGPIQRKVLAD